MRSCRAASSSSRRRSLFPKFFFRRGLGAAAGSGCAVRAGFSAGDAAMASPLVGYGLAAERFHNVEQGELRGVLLLLPLGLPSGAERLPFLLCEAEKVVQGHQWLLRDGFLRFRADNGRFFHNRLRRFPSRHAAVPAWITPAPVQCVPEDFPPVLPPVRATSRTGEKRR